jgi:hypothetical protein
MKKTNRRLLLLCAIVGVTAALAGCGGGSSKSPAPAPAPTPAPAPAPAKPGVLAVSAMPRLDPYPTSAAQFVALANEAFEMVYNAGARGLMTTYTWSALEPTQATYDSAKFDDLAAAVNKAQARGLTQFVGIQIINTTKREMPADLAGQPFDSTAVRARFRALLDRVVTPHRGKIRYLSIGNEVDSYLRAQPAQWASYKRFYDDAAAYARSLDPNIQVGVTGTFDGAASLSTADLQSLNASSDVIVLTYYPLQTDGKGTITARDPSVVARDFDTMLQFAGTRRLVLQEVGYPAALLNNSSEAKQAAFVTNVFAAWKNANDRIPFLNYFLLHDFTQAMCDDFGAYYGLPDVASFEAFLCSLGLRKVDGTPRQAWSTLTNEARGANLP